MMQHEKVPENRILQKTVIMDYTHDYESPLGRITLASDGNSLVGLWFCDQKYYGATLRDVCVKKELPVFDEAIRWLNLYFSGSEPDFTPRLSMRATAFRRAVWRILLTIPFGETVTYGEIAERLAKEMNCERMSARAVGSAVGHNAISLMIPCHRVVGADGSLTGYAGGLERKRRLLELEHVKFPGNRNNTV